MSPNITLSTVTRGETPIQMEPLTAKRRRRANIVNAEFIWRHHALVAASAPKASYIICTNPRSGSWLLSEGLAGTGVAGNPREWFNVLEERAQQHNLDIAVDVADDYTAYIAHVLANATTPNGICGIKLHYYQFAELTQKLAAMPVYRGLGVADIIAAALAQPKYLWLTRRDKARQAISYYRACQTEEWWHIDGIARPEAAYRGTAFDSRAIRQLERTLTDNDEAWRQYFRANDIDALVIDYEDLAVDYSGNITRVLQWLGVQGARQVPVSPPRLKRQADADTDRWLARYLSSRVEADEDGSPEATNDDEQRARSAAANLAIPLQSPLFQRSIQPAVAQPVTRIDKPARVLNALSRVLQLAPHEDFIERRKGLSRHEFLERYYALNRPVVIEGLLASWPARNLWTTDYLKERVGDTAVEIMAGRDADPRYELNIHHHRKQVRFGDYLDTVEAGGPSNDRYLVANNNVFQRPGCDVLLNDLLPFTDLLDPAKMRGCCFLWHGAGGTVTPLHHDACNILMALVRGRKHFKVIPAAQCGLVYNTNSFFSDVDCEAPDQTRWPLFKEATVIDLTLEAGEVLFMPVGWWHHVRTLEISTMVSFTNFVFPNSYDW